MPLEESLKPIKKNQGKPFELMKRITLVELQNDSMRLNVS